MRETASLKRLYTFQDATSDDGKIENRHGWGGDLEYSGENPKSYRVVPGRWPSKKAVRLDKAPLRTKAVDLKKRSFTAEMWFRPLGPGGISGPNFGRQGTLLAVNNGFYAGWRLTMSYPQRTLTFEMARPKPIGAVAIRTIEPLTNGVWHHVAVNWDGARMRLYVNGLLQASGNYNGNYYSDEKYNTFRIGYVGNGLGSIRFDVGEVALYDQAMSAGKIFRHAYFPASPADALVSEFHVAHSHCRAGRFSKAQQRYANILATAALHPYLKSLAQFRLGVCLRDSGRQRRAYKTFKQVASSPEAWHTLQWSAADLALQLYQKDITPSFEVDMYERLLSALSPPSSIEKAIRVRIAAVCQRAGKHEAAARQYAAVLHSSGLSSRERLDVRLKRGHAYQQLAQYQKARVLYHSIINDSKAPVQYLAFAGFGIAECYRAQGKREMAGSTLATMANDRALPRHLRWEAQQRLKEIRRSDEDQSAPEAARRQIRPWEKLTPSMRFYVATTGTDSNPGTRTKPFATLASARNAIRELKKNRGLPKDGVAVILKGGEYRLQKTFHLTAQDSGEKTAPITYRAASGASVRLTGGVPLTGFAPVKQNAFLRRLPASSRSEVLSLDLSELGITDLPEMRPIGWRSTPHPVVELYCNDAPMHLARWPNEENVSVGEVLRDANDDEGGGISFRYKSDRPESWIEPTNVWMYGYWRHLWADHSLKIASIDDADDRIRTVNNPRYGVQTGRPYYYFNVLEELDQPGEWYLDRETNKLLFYPPAPPQGADIRLTTLRTPLLRAENVDYLHLKGLTVEYGSSDGISLQNCSHARVVGCTVRNLAGNGIACEGGTDNGILGSEIYHTGRRAVLMRGGDRTTLTPGNHFIENCHLHHFARIHRAMTAGAFLAGVGNVARYNHFHHGPSEAIILWGNEHLVEFNHIHDVVLEGDDLSGIDMRTDLGVRGNVIRYNYFHHIGNDRPWGQSGVRFDCANSGTLVYGNVFYKCSRGRFGGVQINAGKGNWIDNNLFVDCKYGVSFMGWGVDRWEQFFRRDKKRRKNAGINIHAPPYIEKYPALGHVRENLGRNHIWRNLLVNCGAFFSGDLDRQDVTANRIVRPGNNPGQQNSVLLPIEPDAEILNYPGFRRIPFAEIGPYESKNRAW